MNRKLVQQGKSTLMVSLPKQWIEYHNLEKGNEVHMQQIEDKILISSDKSEEISEITIKLEDSTETNTRTRIANTYRAGFNRITVYFKTNKQFQDLKRVVHEQLIGFEIVAHNAKQCVIESITEPHTHVFSTIIRKVFQNTQQLLKFYQYTIKQKKYPEDLEDIENRLLKYNNFCMRVLQKERLSNQHATFYAVFLTALSQGQRELFHAARMHTASKKSNAVNDLVEHIVELHRAIERAFIHMNNKNLDDVHKHNKEIQDKGLTILQTIEKTNIPSVHHLLIAGRRFHQASSPLMAIITE